MASFKNDYSYLVHPRIINALARYQNEYNDPYGLDKHSKNAERMILDTFHSPGQVFFLAGGTQTNMVFITSILRHYEGVISPDTGHIFVHESGAIAGQGCSIITVKNKDGKLYPHDIKEVMATYNNEHMIKPRLVYISNSTEIGTIYSKDELIALHDICKKYNLIFYIDGARLGSALTSESNDVEPALLGTVCDAFYVGGTKNGLMLGEALVINNRDLLDRYRNHIKNKGAMLAKGYLVGIEFEEAFKDSFYFELARSTNEMANYLKDELKKLNLDMLDSPTNQVFVTFKNNVAQTLIDKYGCELWSTNNDMTTIRFVISFLSTKEEIDELIKDIDRLMK